MSADHVGKEICVSTDDGKFYGTIHSVDGKHGKLILQKGIWLLFDFFEFEIHLSFRMQLPFDNFKSHTVFITPKVYINKSHYANIDLSRNHNKKLKESEKINKLHYWENIT